MNLGKVFKVAKMAGLAAPALFKIFENSDFSQAGIQTKGSHIMAVYTGYDPRTKDFDLSRLQEGWGAFVAVNVVELGYRVLNYFKGQMK